MKRAVFMKNPARPKSSGRSRSGIVHGVCGSNSSSPIALDPRLAGLLLRVDLRFSHCVHPTHANIGFPVNFKEQEDRTFYR